MSKPETRTCHVCGALTALAGPCEQCGAKAKALQNIAAKLSSALTGTFETGDKRPPVLAALVAIASAGVALGFEFARSVWQAALDATTGRPLVGADGQYLLTLEGPREEMVTFLVTAIVIGLYAVGERVAKHWADKSKVARGAGLGLLLLGSLSLGGAFGGCVAREIVPDETVQIDHVEEPCRLRAIVDGHEVFRLRWEHACPIESADPPPDVVPDPAPAPEATP